MVRSGGELRGADERVSRRAALRAAWLDEGGAEAELERAERALGRVIDGELRAREAALLARQRGVEDDLRGAADLRERLLGVVSHDLRSPLSAIAASAEILLRDPAAPPRVERSAQRIARSAKRMVRLIDATLDLTRVRSGAGLPVDRGPADVVAIARQVLDEQRLANPGRTIAFDARGDGRGTWDADRVAQVVSNLLANALAHGAPGGAVRVSVDAAADPVALEVHNEGVIPPEVRAGLFEPFRRGARSGPAPTGGLGLGLFITREIVHAHQGTISVASSDAAGTTFRVCLPRTPPEESAR
jgi:signal transduction histidine kinase